MGGATYRLRIPMNYSYIIGLGTEGQAGNHCTQEMYTIKTQVKAPDRKRKEALFQLPVRARGCQPKTRVKQNPG